MYKKSLSYNVPCFPRISINRELKQQRRRRLRKRQFFLQSVFTLFLNSLGLFNLPQFVKCWRYFLELNFRGLYKSSGQKRGVALHVPCCNRATTAKKCTKQRVKLVFCLSRCHRRLCCLSSQWRFSRNRNTSLEACH